MQINGIIVVYGFYSGRVIMLIEMQQLFLELGKALGRLFLNPLLYWSIILLVISGNRRIKGERKQFGFKIFPIFYELKNTWLPSLIVGIFISVMFLGLEVVFPLPTLLLLILLIILFSLHMKFSLLSASYTVGITFLLILLSPFILQYQDLIDENIFTNSPIMSLGLLLGVLLMFEAFLLVSVGRNNTFPELIKSDRGQWIGSHWLKNLSIIPLFFLVPTEQLGNLTKILPYYPVANEQLSLILFPMVLGFEIPVRRNLPTVLARKMGLTLGIIGFIVATMSIASIYALWLSVLAVIVAILGREYVMYKHKTAEGLHQGFFTRKREGLKVLSVLPDSPARRLGILTGETILKVNDIKVHSVDEFYQALQRSGANYRLEVIDDLGEARLVQSALYAGEHYKLGLIFVDDPHNEMGFDYEEEISREL